MTKLGGIWKPPTIYKAGYPGVSKRTLDNIKYVVYHSAEGFASAIMPIQNNPLRLASWPMTVLLDGTIWEHYEVEDICWISGGPEPNIIGYGVEFEGTAGNPITDAQVQAGAWIYSSLKQKCPNLRGPSLGQGFEEHNRVAPGTTSCPSGRIRWEAIADIINEEEHMGLTEDQNNKLNDVFAKVQEMWQSMFGNERDNIMKQQHRDIIEKIDDIESDGSHTHGGN